MTTDEELRELVERARKIAADEIEEVTRDHMWATSIRKGGCDNEMPVRVALRTLNAAREEGKASNRPQGAGWSEPPKEEASHPERLSADELRLTGSSLSTWAWEHLSRGYGVSLTVREVSRLIAGVAAEASASKDARIAELEGERGAALALASATKERCDHAEALWQAAEAALAEARTQIEQLKTALPDCHVCGGSGKIHEDAVTTGRNQHSACVGPCDHCDGLGVEL